MGNTVTVTAFFKLFMNCRIMWSAMAIHTLRQMAVLWMALGAGKGRMLCSASLQQFICLIMTTGTDLLGLGKRIGDLQRGMHGMAGQAVRGIKYCHGTVVLVAFITHGNAAMFFRMAGGAFLLRMHAYLCLQTCRNLGMAQLAAAFEVNRGRDGCQGLVRVGMTCKTLCHRFGRTMGCIMAAGTLGHDFRVIIASRVISMEYLVTLGADYTLMLCTIIPQPFKMRCMAAGTLLQCERL